MHHRPITSPAAKCYACSCLSTSYLQLKITDRATYLTIRLLTLNDLDRLSVLSDVFLPILPRLVRLPLFLMGCEGCSGET